MRNVESGWSSLIRGGLFVAAVVSAGCVDKVDTSLKSCPCAEGNVCCESGVCASDVSQCAEATAALSASVAGRWTGYIENFATHAPAREDQIAITMEAAADGTLSGQVVFGVSAAPPPATDPDLAWPAEYLGYQTSYIPGWSYVARDSRWDARRLKLRIKTYEPWEDWCALQPATYPHPEIGLDHYNCAPSGIVQRDDGCWYTPDPSRPDEVVELSCDKPWMCDQMCTCDAIGCKAVEDVFSSMDIAFRGGEAEGSISIFNVNFNVRLTRAPGNAPK